MARLKSPEQVKRIDGRGCFMEMLTTGLPLDKICMNFVSYNTAADKGKRIGGAVMVYLDVHKADVLAENILSGKISKLGEKSKADAAAGGYKYAKEVFRDITGTPSSRSKREDGKPASRQLKLTPGSSQAWVLSAETGEGKETATGAISPAYSRPETIIRIPMSDDDLKGFALTLRHLVQMWYAIKFMPVAAKDVEKPNPTESVFSVKSGKVSMKVTLDAIGIDQVKFTLSGKSQNVTLYLGINKAQVLAQDLLSGKILKQKAIALSEKDLHTVYVTYGGGRHGSSITCRTFEIVVDSEGRHAIHGAVGEGELTGDGRIAPKGKPSKSLYVAMEAEELKELGYVLRGIAQAWTTQKFGALIADDMERVRKEARSAIAAISAGEIPDEEAV